MNFAINKLRTFFLNGVSFIISLCENILELSVMIMIMMDSLMWTYDLTLLIVNYITPLFNILRIKILF